MADGTLARTRLEERRKQVGRPGHLSLSPVGRSPDLQARSTSFSKSVCKTEMRVVSACHGGAAASRQWEGATRATATPREHICMPVCVCACVCVRTLVHEHSRFLCALVLSTRPPHGWPCLCMLCAFMCVSACVCVCSCAHLITAGTHPVSVGSIFVYLGE